MIRGPLSLPEFVTLEHPVILYDPLINDKKAAICCIDDSDIEQFSRQIYVLGRTYMTMRNMKLNMCFSLSSSIHLLTT